LHDGAGFLMGGVTTAPPAGGLVGGEAGVDEPEGVEPEPEPELEPPEPLEEPEPVPPVPVPPDGPPVLVAGGVPAPAPVPVPAPVPPDGLPVLVAGGVPAAAPVKISFWAPSTKPSFMLYAGDLGAPIWSHPETSMLLPSSWFQ